MDKFAKISVLAELIDKMKEKGSWCGETHIQKAALFLQDVLQVPLNVEFVLYKHGPFSFDLRDILSIAKADMLLDYVAQPVPYGPKWNTTELSKRLRSRFPNTMEANKAKIQFVADHLGSKDVVQLERLATAFFIQRENKERTDAQIAARVHELKPHVSEADALAALVEARAIACEAQQLGVTQPGVPAA